MSRLPPALASRPTLLVLGPLFVALSGLAFLFPLSGDDWSWGSSDGIGRLHDGFAGYNGRYLGNLSVLVLTRTHWLTPFVVSATLCLLIWLVARIAAVPSPTGVLIAGALVLAMPLGQWRRTRRVVVRLQRLRPGQHRPAACSC